LNTCSVTADTRLGSSLLGNLRLCWIPFTRSYGFSAVVARVTPQQIPSTQLSGKKQMWRFQTGAWACPKESHHRLTFRSKSYADQAEQVDLVEGWIHVVRGVCQGHHHFSPQTISIIASHGGSQTAWSYRHQEDGLASEARAQTYCRLLVWPRLNNGYCPNRGCQTQNQNSGIHSKLPLPKSMKILTSSNAFPSKYVWSWLVGW